MSMGTQNDQGQQEEIGVPQAALAKRASHPFYRRVTRLLDGGRLDALVEECCRQFYARRDRSSVAPGVYFRLLLMGYFEVIDLERGIAWRAQGLLA